MLSVQLWADIETKVQIFPIAENASQKRTISDLEKRKEIFISRLCHSCVNILCFDVQFTDLCF